MEAKAYKRINYKSDFILTLNSDAGWMTPFCIKFWTGAPSQAYFVGWDGTTYTHCSYDPSEPTKLLVQFDDHHLPIGDLKFQIAYHFTVADFPNDTEDEVINPANITTEIDGQEYQVMLDFTGETAPDIQFSLPAYANEAQRIANEQQRIANEEQRIADEQQRIQHEETREANESQRIRQEQGRVAAEEARTRQYAQDHQTAVNDHTRANEDHQRADEDHSRAESDHGTASNDHTTATNDHTRAGQDHQQATNDHTRAEGDHTRAGEDHTTATSDHTRAGEDHQESVTQSAYAKDQGDYAKIEGDYAKDQGDYAKQKGDDAAAQMQQQAQAFNEAQAARQTAYEQAEGTESGSVAGDGSRWGAFKTNEAARDAKVDAKVADITNLQEAVAEGAVYDISANNSGASYADLTAALGNDGANVPVDKRKGGMSIKFVCSSDNKYVQYRLMSDTFNTTVANWQGVDDRIMADSKNPVNGGGIYEALYVQYGSLKNAQTNTISTVIVTKKSNGVSFNLRRIEQITFVAVTGTISFYRCHYSSDTNKFVVKELLSSVDNSSAENGSTKTIDVSIELLENEFIGVSGAVAFMMNLGNDFVSDGFNNRATYTSYTEVVGQNIAVIYSSKKYVTKSEYDTNKESTITEINKIKNAISEEISYGAAQIDGVTPSLSTSNPYVSWITKDPNNTKLSHVSKIKFYAGIGTTVLYKVAINSGVATTTQITSITLTSEGLREVDVNIDLAENEYIGWGGNISYKNDSTLGYKTVTLNNGSMTEGNMWVGLEILDYRFIDLNDIKDEISEIKHYEVIVDINGKGEYLNPFDAMVGLLGKDTAEHPITIKVLPGIYNMPGLKYRDYYTYCVDRHLSIVGTDKVNCILRNDNGYYNPSRGQQSLDDVADAAPLKIAGNVYIANLTIISTDAENAESQDAVDHQSYCIHVDSDSAEGNTLEIHNCKLVNNHFACVGFGIRKNNTLKITDSELYADFFDTSSAILSGHNNNGGSSITPEEHLFVKNCTLVSSNGNAVKVINPTQANGAKFDCVFVNNVVDIPADKGVVLANVVSLDKLCYGNNLPSMNYTE